MFSWRKNNKPAPFVDEGVQVTPPRPTAPPKSSNVKHGWAQSDSSGTGLLDDASDVSSYTGPSAGGPARTKLGGFDEGKFDIGQEQLGSDKLASPFGGANGHVNLAVRGVFQMKKTVDESEQMSVYDAHR